MTSVSIPGYQVSEELYNGSRTLVYLGYRETDSLPVVIKLLKNPYPSFSELVQFRNQYTIAKNLNSPLIVQTYSLEPYQNGYALVMEFGGISLKEWGVGGSLQSLQEFLLIAIALCNILDILYRERIIHKDIKPNNILINPETKQVKLIDFSIASLLPRETQTLISPNVLEGTLAYISPEQTGRMNRGIDYRTDFYSVGVTFYELLAGVLPFQSNDPMELVHCHIASSVPLVHEIHPQIPSVLSEIVSKLMAKNAEDRYQSALGLKFDLETCLHQLNESGEIKSFSIAQRDVCNRFIIPDKLYGREAQIETLLEAFERVSLGATEMMLVAGFSGIGKTAVVNEVHKPIVRQRGYFIKGKFDQFERSIPFSAFVQAFRDLMAQLFSESDHQVKQWKSKILTALGESAQVMIEVIPELERIIGKQPPVPQLSGSAAQNRFNLLFQRFIQIFTTKDRPLVIFLDDLQWADSASLELMRLLMSTKDTNHLLIIGAYRDNEVFCTHPLMLILAEIQKAQVTVNTITLTPLDKISLNQLVLDTLSCSLDLALPLTELVLAKTQGNPFFSTQFLKALHEDRLITFDFNSGCWQCNISEIKTLVFTNDVVEFMALQLKKLPEKTQEVLKLAACIGNEFDLTTLAIVHEQSPAETASNLWKALQEGLILPISDGYKFFQDGNGSLSTVNGQPSASYKFLHDRVQQAAYFLIPESQKKSTHLKIGNLLLKNTSPKELESHVFEIVNHLNVGIDESNKILEIQTLAQLNLIAGKKAKTSTAYKAAVKYFNFGIKSLPNNSWQTNYELTFGLYRDCAECEYLVSNFNQAEKFFDIALKYAQNEFDLADIYGIQLNLRATQGENLPASFAAGLNGLSVLGMSIPSTSEGQQALIETVLEELQAQLQNVQPADLFNLPEMTDPAKKICMHILADLWGSAYIGGNQHLTILSALLMLNTSLKYGNAESSGCAYCLHGMTLTNQGDYQTAYEFGTLGRNLDRHFNSTKFIPKSNNVFGHTINPYNQHLKTNLSVYQQSFQTSRETGDILFGIWAVLLMIWTMLIKGDRLPDVYAETEKYQGYVQQVNNVNMLYGFTLQQQFLLHLQGLSPGTDLLHDQDSQNIPCIEVWIKNNFAAGINWYYFLKLQLLYLYGRYTDAVKAAIEAEKTLASNLGFFPIMQYHFYYPLSLAALYPTATSEEKKQYWEILLPHQQIIKNWSDNCPENFLHRYLLLSAEMAKISHNYQQAIEYYDRAIIAARQNEYLHEEALANELAARFYLEWGKERIAQEYMTLAYYGYARWGALAKVTDLERRYPQLLAPITEQTRSPFSTNETMFALGNVTSTSSATTSSSVSVALDVAAILKASQTISGEIELEKLLKALLDIVIENAGADKCVFMFLESGRLLIQALARLSQGIAHIDFHPMLLNPQSVEDSVDVPVGLINTVKRSLQPAVIINATVDPQLINDPYIQQQQPKSILCSPILHQGKLLGVLYLENNLATGAFTSDRVELLNLLCAQVAISLENARLYAREQEKSQSLQASLEQLKQIEASLAKEREFLNAIIHNITDGIVVCDASGKLTLFNNATREFHGLPVESLPPEQWAEHFSLYQPDGQTPLSTTEIPLFRALQGEIVENAEMIIAPKHGSTRILLASGQAIFDPWGNKLGAVVVMRDISDRKLAELALQQKSLLLAQALTDLQNAQLQIVQSEKMSALGNLVAGVAHEMNNPLGFIAASLKQAKPSIADLVEHLRLYQESLLNKSEEIIAHAEEIDLEYSLEDLPKMIDSMTMACNRLKNISTSLRTFSRADKDYKVLFNIHEGIDSTILILKHRLKANEKRPAIEVITKYGTLPQIECFPGQLNQVFMNVLANAIDALEESNNGRIFEEIKAKPNHIFIKTSVTNNQVQIAIADNGIGMDEQVKQKIFDHLFTTKAVGQGTGLGLAIAQQIIVEKHNGTLAVNSTLGEGTEFVITLPILAQTLG